MSTPFIVAAAILLGLLFFLFRQLRSFGKPEWETVPAWKKAALVLAWLIPAFVLGILFWAIFIEPNRLVLNTQTIKIDAWPAGLRGIRIVTISDIHTGAPFINEAKLHRIVELTNAQNADLIVILGDYMSPNNWRSRRVEPEVTAAVLKDLKAPLGVYAVLGNHDWWYNGERCRRAFENNGIRILEDEVTEVKWRNSSFWLAGFGDLWTRGQHINQVLAKAPPGVTVIGLTHNPDIFPQLPSYVPLLLAGHTHGGQVTLPVIGAAVVPSDYGQKYTAGHIYENGHHLFVTTGIGTSILPVRFRVPPEIAVLTITN